MNDILEMIIPFMGMMGLGGMILIGMRLRYEHVRQRNIDTVFLTKKSSSSPKLWVSCATRYG